MKLDSLWHEWNCILLSLHEKIWPLSGILNVRSKEYVQRTWQGFFFFLMEPNIPCQLTYWTILPIADEPVRLSVMNVDRKTSRAHKWEWLLRSCTSLATSGPHFFFLVTELSFLGTSRTFIQCYFQRNLAEFGNKNFNKRDAEFFYTPTRCKKGLEWANLIYLPIFLSSVFLAMC